MNLKKAKRLRRAAEALTAGAPARQLVRKRGQFINAPGTTRTVYRHLKETTP